MSYAGSDLDSEMSDKSNPVALRWLAWSRGHRGGQSKMIYKVNARGPTGNNILQTERIVLASLLNHVSVYL